MAYVGRGIDKISNVEVLDNITFSGASSYTLQKGSVNYVPSSSANLLISIDGVVQANNFTINGSTIDFGVAVANTSTCNFVLHYGIGVITTPQDGSVTTVKIGDDAVTYAKLQNLATANRVLGSASTGLIGETQVATAMVSDDAITYAKMQDTSAANKVLGAVSAGTVGEVSIATDMIADAQVDEAKLKISNNPTNGYFLSAQSGNTGGMTWAEAGGGAVQQMVQVYKTDVVTQAGGSNGHNVFFDISGLSVTITPTKASSKLLIDLRLLIGNNENYGTAKIVANVDGGSFADVGPPDSSGNMTRGWIGNHHRQSSDNTESCTYSNQYLWTPTYDLGEAIIIKCQWSMAAGATVVLNRSKQSTNATNTFLGTSGITVTEIN